MNATDVLLWKKKRTLGWLNLSLAARGASEGITCALDERGELRLGKPGLPGLAALLARPWAEVQPAIAELLEAGRFVVDEARGVIFDPEHEERQAPLSGHGAAIAATTATAAAMAEMAAERPPRPLSMTPNAVRKRERRQRFVREQIELSFAAADAATAAAPLSDLRISSSDQSEAARPRSRPAAANRIVLSPTDVPSECASIATRDRPDLDTVVIARSWKRFAIRKSKKFATWDAIHAEWEGWIGDEGRHRDAKPGKPKPLARASPPPPPAQERAPTTVDPELGALFASGAQRIEARARAPVLSATG